MGDKKTTPQQEVKLIEKDAATLQGQADALHIKTPADLEAATEFVANVKARIDSAEKMQAFFTDPYVEQRRVALDKKREIETLFDGTLAPLRTVMSKVKRSISDYTLEEERKARAEEERKRKIREAADAKRAEQGKDAIVEPVKSVERAAPTVKTAAGRTTTSKVWVHEITDVKALQKDKTFLGALVKHCKEKGIYDQVLRQMVKDGVREVGGVRIYEDVKVSVSAN
jgi:hypothetical protein